MAKRGSPYLRSLRRVPLSSTGLPTPAAFLQEEIDRDRYPFPFDTLGVPMLPDSPGGRIYPTPPTAPLWGWLVLGGLLGFWLGRLDR